MKRITLEEDGIRLIFILDGKIVSNTKSLFIPAVGDFLYLILWDSNHTKYQVKDRNWIYGLGEILKIEITIFKI